MAAQRAIVFTRPVVVPAFCSSPGKRASLSGPAGLTRGTILVGAPRSLLDPGGAYALDLRLMTTTDQQLMDILDRAQGGDAVAFREIADRYRPYVRAIARQDAPSDVLARAGLDDLVQEILVAVWTGLPKTTFDSRFAFEGWLAKVSRHRLVDVVRRSLSVKRGRPGATLSISNPSRIHDPARPVTSPSRAMRREEAAIGVRRILERLPEPYREVLELVRIHHRKTNEVAEILGLTPAAVRKRLERALALSRDIAEGDSFAGWK